MDAEGTGQEIFLQAKAMSERIKQMNDVIEQQGFHAIQFKLAEQYIESLKSLQGKNVIMKMDINNPEKIIEKSKSFLNQL